MKKKIYTTPALSVVEYDMTQVICTSGNKVNNVSGGDLSYGGGNNGAARANNRGGIWDED